MLRNVFSYGALAGMIVGIPLFALTVAGAGRRPLSHSAVIGYCIMLIALSTVFVAIKRYRDDGLGGVVRFWPAFGLGVGISFVASLFYVVAWEAALAVTHLDYGSSYASAMIEQQRAKGVTGEALARFVATMDAFKAQYRNPLYRLPMTFAEIFPVGVLVSAVSAALLRNRRFLPARRA